nr:ATP-binding cassette domain-containing protein [Arboricoccus pini]
MLLQNFDASFTGGGWTCLLGPSGSGKTTLLRLAADLQQGGRAIADDGMPLAGRVAYMAQTDLLLPWLSAEANVLLGWRLRGHGRVGAAARARARALLAEVGLGDQAGLLPQALSGGMRQRVALARTLMEDRPVVLMDEPFSALDAITRYRLQDLAAGLLAGRTVLQVTHDPLEALRLGQEILVLKGRPARLAERIHLSSPPPRPADAPELTGLHAKLLAALAGSPAPERRAAA